MNMKRYITLFLVCSFVTSVVTTQAFGTEVIYQHGSPDDKAREIELESRFNDLNTPLKKIYEEGLGYLKSSKIVNDDLRRRVEEASLNSADESSYNIALEAVLYAFSNEVINLIIAEYGEDKLFEYYPQSFIDAIAKPPILLSRKKVQSIISYATKNLSAGKQLSLKGSFKDKAPMIDGADLSSLDFSIISLEGIPIWDAKFERSQIVQNSLCLCDDANLTAADISASLIHRCKACDVRHDILKTQKSDSQQLLCKGVKAERTKFSMNQLNMVFSDFSYADLRNSTWIGSSRLAGSNFHAANFVGALIEKFSCNECNFTSVKLEAIKILGFLDLVKADIEDEVITELAGVDNVYLSSRDFEKIPNYTTANKKRYDILLEGQKYRYDLSGINLANKYIRLIVNDKVILDGANFLNSIIEDSYIDGASMKNVNFTGSQIIRSILIGDMSGASMRDTKRDDESQIIQR